MGKTVKFNADNARSLYKGNYRPNVIFGAKLANHIVNKLHGVKVKPTTQHVIMNSCVKAA